MRAVIDVLLNIEEKYVITRRDVIFSWSGLHWLIYGVVVNAILESTSL